ncbi:hypothetical protein [Aquisalimonas sp.]|uniref:hypothetical protein n=1 Tax=Aquisalimonas sp. TaxID=1872621 RepID=UPI0025C41BF8|nr:hypothetical protein [Aquisalimonas sp.]
MSQSPEPAQRRVKRHFRNGPPDAEDQTRIALFLQSVKGLNASVLAKLEWQPMDWMPYRWLHSQYYREMELSTLVGRATQWSTQPLIYMEAAQISVDLWGRTQAARYLPGFFEVDKRFYSYLALSHAFMSVIRLLPVLPPSMDLETDPFLSALKAIEEENGRQIQTQIRLLKELDAGLSRQRREGIVEDQRQCVEGCFAQFLETLGQPPGATLEGVDD